MRTFILEREQWLARPLEEVFAFFSRPENLERITPPWLNFHMVEVPRELAAGSLIRYRLRVHGLPIRWTTKIATWNPPHSFTDDQLAGPYALWHHEHTFASERGGTTMRDRVTYALPFGWLGLAGLPLVKNDVEKIFNFRAETMKELFP